MGASTLLFALARGLVEARKEPTSARASNDRTGRFEIFCNLLLIFMVKLSAMFMFSMAPSPSGK
jgi:hypothetical protein